MFANDTKVKHLKYTEDRHNIFRPNTDNTISLRNGYTLSYCCYIMYRFGLCDRKVASFRVSMGHLTCEDPESFFPEGVQL